MSRCVDARRGELAGHADGRCRWRCPAGSTSATQLTPPPPRELLGVGAGGMRSPRWRRSRQCRAATRRPMLAPGRRGRLLLAKNPAGWVEMLELLDSEPGRPGHRRLQQPHRRRPGSVLALGRALRAIARTPGAGDRRAAGGRRGPAGIRGCRAQAVPHAPRPPLPTRPKGCWTSSRTTRPSATCWCARTGRVGMTTESATRIALVYPELLGTYGDGGNAQVLATRLRWRGLAAEIVSVPAGAALPDQCDLYLLGGGEDEPQVLAVDGLREGRAAGPCRRAGRRRARGLRRLPDRRRELSGLRRPAVRRGRAAPGRDAAQLRRSGRAGAAACGRRHRRRRRSGAETPAAAGI